MGSDVLRRLSPGRWTVAVTIAWLSGWLGYLVYTGSLSRALLVDLLPLVPVFVLLAFYVRYTSRDTYK